MDDQLKVDRTEEEEPVLAKVDAAPDSIFLIDLEGTVLAANETADNQLGQPKGSVIGRKLFQLLPEKLAASWRERADQAILSGQPIRFEEERQGLTIENSVCPLCDEHGDVSSLVFIGRDVAGRVKGRAALRDSERRFRSLFENSPMAISIVRNGATIDANPAYLTMFGYSELQEVRSAHLLSQIAPQCHGEIGDRARRREQGEAMPNVYETVGLRKDGSQFPLHAMVSRMDLPDGPVTIGFFSDVSERRRAEAELQKLASVVRYSSELVNLATLDGKMTFLNEAGCRMLGISPAEVEQTRIMQVIPDLFREKVENELMPALMKDGAWAGDLQYRNLKTGQLTDVQATTFIVKDPQTGEPLFLANVSIDITDRKRTEQALQESERKFHTTIKNLDEGYYCCTPEGLLLEHNVAFNRILGFSSEEDLKGERLPDFWQNPEDRKKYLDELASKGFIRNYLINVKRINGEKIVVMASAHLFTDDKSQLIRIEGAFTDFTKQKRMEEELILARNNLERRISERTRELQEAISYNRSLIEASVDPLVTIGPEGKITDVNQTTETITGKTRRELIGTDFSDYFTDPEKARAGYRQVFAKGIVRDYELFLRHADGHTTPVHYNATVYRDSRDQVVGVFAAARDVTERKSAEEKLLKSRQLLDETGRLARVGGWELDLRDHELSWSDMVYQIHEIDPAFRPTLEAGINFYAPESIPVISEAVQRAMEEGEPFDLELQVITAKGNRRWVRAIGQAYRVDGKIVKLGGVFQDIHDRKLAENELKRHRDHLEELVSERTAELIRSRELLLEAETVAQLGSWEWDAVRDEITGSAEFYRLFEVGVEQIAHLSQFIGLLHADDRERVQHDIADALEHRRMYDTDFRVIRSDGEWRTINARGRMFFDEKGKPLRMVGTCMNITERKRLEEELAKKAEELARSNAELEQFAYVASHDLQEPLRMISSYVQLLARHNQGKLDSDSEEFIAYATDGANRMQALIQDLLAFSRVETRGKPFLPTDCDTVLERALNHLKVAIEETGARITSDSLPLVRADDSQLVQLFQNLVGNALKFHRPEIPPIIHICVERRGTGWLFAVRDNGIGIPSEQRERVFEIFQRLHGHGEYPGTGIGLAVCRKIVERHGGRIWVESVVGEGSTFTFSLP